ncbi:hypothetical protein GGS26DRAFT_473275 [Hypomontagnella submonticulosa]|nr:hypothetical protein GGS26DRAFT_473275 [Hypomontagnella submonticulosa]
MAFPAALHMPNMSRVGGSLDTTHGVAPPEIGEYSPGRRSDMVLDEDQDEITRKQLVLSGREIANDKPYPPHMSLGDNYSPLRNNREYHRGNSTRSGAPNNHGLGEIPSRRSVNGFWDPRHAADITVHLNMSLQEDLDESLEEFCRLQRLGDFTSARQFFAEYLHGHLHRPYILVEYAEMLLEQGDFNTLSEIDDNAIYNAAGNLRDNRYGGLLMSYWELIRIFGACHKPNALLRKFNEITKDALNKLGDLVGHTNDDEERDVCSTDITSTEIKMLALAHRVANLPDKLLRRRLGVLFPPEFYRTLYGELLRQGRIWDLHDIAVARMATPNLDISHDWSDDPDFRTRIQNFIKDWTGMLRVHDTSTTLALLGVLMSLAQHLAIHLDIDGRVEIILDLSAPLAFSIMENDPSSMRSRSFMRWMLMKPLTEGQNRVISQLSSFESLAGVALYSNHFELSLYIPAELENPGWHSAQSRPDLEDIARMVLETSQDLSDCQTEAMSLRELIKISTSPEGRFEELGKLEKITQGDIRHYSNTLISKYQVSNTGYGKYSLNKDITELLSTPFLFYCLDPIDSWALKMLQYTLDEGELAADEALEEARRLYSEVLRGELPESLRREIEHKMPHMKSYSRKRSGDSLRPKLNEHEIRYRENQLNFDAERRNNWWSKADGHSNESQAQGDEVDIKRVRARERGRRNTVEQDSSESNYEVDSEDGSVEKRTTTYSNHNFLREGLASTTELDRRTIELPRWTTAEKNKGGNDKESSTESREANTNVSGEESVIGSAGSDKRIGMGTERKDADPEKLEEDSMIEREMKQHSHSK